MNIPKDELAYNVVSREIVKLKSSIQDVPPGFWPTGFGMYYDIEREDGTTGKMASYFAHTLDMHPEALAAFETRQANRLRAAEPLAFTEGTA